MEQLLQYMEYFIEKKAFQYQPHYRFIGVNGVSDNTAEFSKHRWNEHPLKGWGKPDVQVHGVEIKYLWKQFEPMSFEQWKQKNKPWQQ
jgi:hypothetical protein